MIPHGKQLETAPTLLLRGMSRDVVDYYSRLRYTFDLLPAAA